MPTKKKARHLITLDSFRWAFFMYWPESFNTQERLDIILELRPFDGAQDMLSGEAEHIC
jgi:hypothetical protein